MGDQLAERERAPVQTAADAEEKHLGPGQLADREGVPVATVYGWNKTGTGPRYMKIGRHVRYRLADVVAWENSRVVTSRTA